MTIDHTPSLFYCKLGGNQQRRVQTAAAAWYTPTPPLPLPSPPLPTLSVVEGGGFLEFMANVEPDYRVPGRTLINCLKGVDNHRRVDGTHN